MISANPNEKMHASAPDLHRCADCSIDGEACPRCYQVWWQRRHPNVTQDTSVAAVSPEAGLATGWQPIETAPKHRPVLVYMRGTAGLGIYRATFGRWVLEDGGEYWRPVGYTLLDRFPDGADITHWMPLPDAPIVKEQIEHEQKDEDLSRVEPQPTREHGDPRVNPNEVNRMSEQDGDIERYLIPKGTIVHMAGFPVEIEETTTVSMHRANWPLIREAMEFPPLAAEPVAD